MRNQLRGIEGPIGLVIHSPAVAAWLRVIAGPIGLLLAAQTVVITADSRAPFSLRVAEPVLALPPPPPQPARAPEPELPLISGDTGKAKVIAQARVLGHNRPLLQDEVGNVIAGGLPKEFVRANAPPGNAIPIENESALGAFHAALRRLREGKLEGGKVRILSFGASHTQADLYLGYLRTYFQQLFGNGGPGFVNVSKLEVWDKKIEVKINSSGFKVQRIHGLRPAVPGYFGLLGAAAVASGSSPAHAWLDLTGSAEERREPMTVQLHSMGTPDGSEFEVQVDGVASGRFVTRTPSPIPLFHRVNAPNGFARIELRKLGPGTLRIFGAVIERTTPGVVVDNLGIQGTKLTDMLEADESVWSAAVRERKPQLVMLAYGTNEYASGVNLVNYRTDIEQSFERLKRAAPEASCLVIGPGDLGKARTPKLKERLAVIIETHREFALRYGCGFWDAFAFMGGHGSMLRWVSANPPLAASDKTHLNPRGYVLMGMRLADALLQSPSPKTQQL